MFGLIDLRNPLTCWTARIFLQTDSACSSVLSRTVMDRHSSRSRISNRHSRRVQRRSAVSTCHTRLDTDLTSSYIRIMETTRLSSKGQIILPKAVRDAHHWEPGTDFSIEDTGDGVLLRPLKTAQPTRLDDVVGCLRVKGPARTIKAMDAAIGGELRARRDRGRY